MDSQDSHLLIVKTRDGDCTVIHEGVSLLKQSHSNVRKLFRKLVERAGESLDYDFLEREVYGNEPSPDQGAYNTKNAVLSLREALFPFDASDGKMKWRSEIRMDRGKKDSKLLLLLEKPHASRICLTLPQPVGDADVFLDLEESVKSPVSPGHTDQPPFTVPVASSKHFFGRDSVLTDLHDKLTDGSCVAVCGAGGMGKTQLAAEYAHIYKAGYPGGVYWIDAKDVHSVQEEFAVLSRDFDNFRTPQDLPIEERAKRVRERFQQMDAPSLLILDSLVPDQKLLKLLPTTGCCRIIATTRRQSLLKSRFHMIDLQQLDVGAALLALQCCCTVEQTADRLVAREPGLSREEAIARERTAIEKIKDDLNQRLPLTMTLIAYYVDQRRITFEECRRRLESNSLKVFERAEVGYSIQDAFKLSRTELTDQAWRVLATASCFARRNISPDLLREAASINDIEQFDDAVTLLDLSSFISVEDNGRITVHDVLRDITLDQIDSDERNRLLQRTAGTLLACLEHANETMTWISVRDEIVQSRAVVDTCRRHQMHTCLVGLMYELGQYYRLHDETATALGYFDEAATTTAAYMPNNIIMFAKCKMQVCAANPFTTSAITNARQALHLARNGAGCGDLSMAEYYNVVGLALNSNNHPWRALPFYCRALHLCETAVGRRSVSAGEYLNNIGVLFLGEKDFSKAAEYLLESIEILAHFYGEDHRSYAIALNNLGRVQRSLGDSESALAHHIQAQCIFETLFGRETKDSAMSLFFAAGTLASLGRKEAAWTNANVALEILERRYGKTDSAACRVRESLETGDF